MAYRVPVAVLAGKLVGGTEKPTVSLVCVYRSRNVENVLDVIRSSGATAARVRLWALDEIAAPLASMTCGSGPGPRFELLQRCVDALPPDDDAWLIICDDDVRVTGGSLQIAVTLCSSVGIDLAQPAHDARSFRSWPINGAKPHAVARLTTFVEIGPVLLVSPRAARRILPLPSGQGMGWGVDVRWSALRSPDFRIGVIDCVRIRHLSPPGTAYDLHAEQDELETSLARAGYQSMEDMQRTERTLGIGSLLARGARS